MAVKENIQQKGLSNPAALALASSPAGQDAIAGAVKSTVSIAKITLAVVATTAIGYIAYSIYKNRFITLGTNPQLDPANVNTAQAKAKAEAIYQAMYGWGADVDVVAEQLAGLNYNGWVEVYNAFGKRRGSVPGTSEMDLIEWLNDQFSGSKMETLRFILPGLF